MPPRHRLVDRLASGELSDIRRKLGERASAAGVRRADVDALEAVEHVELRQRQAVEAVDARGVADGDRVVPAASARAAGDCAIFAPALPQPVAHFAGELGGERYIHNARGIRHDDAQISAEDTM